MKSDVPWHVKVRPEARESAREAARRSGMSVGEWLDSVIANSARNEGVEQAPYAPAPPEPESAADWEPRTQRPPYAEYDDRHRSPSSDERQHPGVYEPYRPPARDLRAAAYGADRPASHEQYSQPVIEQEIAEVNQRLNDLTRQLDKLARLNSNAHLAAPPRGEPPPLVEAISKLDRRLDKLIEERRPADNDLDRHTSTVADLGRESPRPPVAAIPASPLDQALMEIADRQRALDEPTPRAAAHPAMPSEPLPRARTQELAGLERELRQINTQIESLNRPCKIDSTVSKAVDTLRDDLAEIGIMLQEAMPRRAVEALEGEIRKLADRIAQTRDAGAGDAAVAGIERGLAEVRDALRDLTPAEKLVGFDQAVQELSQKIDRIAGQSQDPVALKQLEGAIVAMRGIVSHVASNDALAKLSEEVRSLAVKVDQASAGGGNDLLSSLERRIGSLADALEARNRQGHEVPHELDAVVKGLIDKIERIQLTRGDNAALGHLEDRIAKLVEKLDASDARLNHLEAIERGLAELLIHLEHQRVPHLARASAGPVLEVDTLHRDLEDLIQTEKKTQDSLEAVHGTLGLMVERLAMIETDIRDRSTTAAPTNPPVSPMHDIAPPAWPPTHDIAPPSAPAQLQTAPTLATPTPPAFDPPPTIETEPPTDLAVMVPDAAPPAAVAAPERRPIDPSLPPDHPLEPGFGVTRGRSSGSPAGRIAASEAALGPAKPPVIPDPAGKSNFIAAARRAAQAAVKETPVRSGAAAPNAVSRGRKFSKLATLLGKHARALTLGLSVLVIVLGSLHLAMTWFGGSDETESGAANQTGETTLPAHAPVASIETPPPMVPAQPPGGRQSAVIPPHDGPSAAPSSLLLATEMARHALTAAAPKTETPPVAAREATGALPPPATTVPPAAAAAVTQAPAAVPRLPAPAPSAVSTSAGDKLPAAIGGALRAAAVKGEAAAQFEIGQRYAEGRGLPQNFAEAAEWFERAAKQGLAPAQFRLGGLHEKGLGVKKNPDAARRFYLAAGEAGNAKALHNLAVLYAEGIDGKPDFLTAAKWFRRAAGYGIADSQYNLAILYARGIGVEQNLAEAYKWFALAAREGDKEAAKKRDDLGSRLDARALSAAQAALQTWTAEAQPETATQVKAPPGGWDAPPPAPPPKRKPPIVGPKLDLSLPPAAQ